MITIRETTAFDQTITAVLDGQKILDLRKGEVSEHAKQCARWHANKQSQGMVKITRVGGMDSHMKAVEG